MGKREAILQIQNLSVEFRTAEGTVRAVNHLDYVLHEKEALGIVGESGSGKSVSSLATMRLIPDPPGKVVNGKILYKKQDLLQATEKEMEAVRGNEISMIFQEPMTSLNPIITCGDQIAEVLILHKGMKKKEARKNAVELMRSVGISNPEMRAVQYPHQMSGGMRQRVMIAMALACRPKILIADEPTTALDVTIQAQILDLIKSMNRESDTAVIMISHDLGVVNELCERVIVMYTGRVMEEADTRELFSKPLHPYTIGLMNAIPKIEKEKKPLLTIPGVVPDPTEEIIGCSFCPRCDRAMEICREKEPPVFNIEGHKVRCWMYSDKREVYPGERGEDQWKK